MMKNNVTQFPLNKEDIMRLKPEDICGRVWKESEYGLPVADIPNSKDTNDDKRLKIVRNDIRITQSVTIIEKIDNYIEDTVEQLWYILKGLFKK